MTRTVRKHHHSVVPLLFALLLALGGAGLTGAGEAGEAREMATVYVVRHAEKQTGDDPGLTAAGRERARQLAHVLEDAGIDAVFSTDWARTRETAAPVAAAAGLSPQFYASADEVAGAIRRQSGGEAGGDTFLVVGHSNTLDDVAASLGVTGLSDLDESEYDHLYVIHLHPSGAFLERLRFGAPSPVDGQPTEPR